MGSCHRDGTFKSCAFFVLIPCQQPQQSFIFVIMSTFGKPNWYGIRNRALIDASAIPVTDGEVRAKFDELFPMAKPAPVTVKPDRVYYDRKRLADLKAYVEFDGVEDWDSFKRRRTGRMGKVSNTDFADFLNNEA